MLHQSFGPCFIFCEKAESRACCWSIGDGVDEDTGAVEDDVGGVKNGGWGKGREENGNWGGRPRLAASGPCARRASCLEWKGGYPRPSLISSGIPSLRGLNPGPNPSNPFSCIAFLVL